MENTLDEEEKQALYEELVQKMYERGKAISAASFLEFDEVIDPKDTRKWIVTALDSIPENTYKNQPHRIVDRW